MIEADLDELGHHRPSCACSICASFDRALARIAAAGEDPAGYEAGLERFDAVALLGACARGGLPVDRARGLLGELRRVYASGAWR